MIDQSTIYPNINWHQFAVINDNATDAFEDMCRDLFFCEYLHETRNPHSDHNNPGSCRESAGEGSQNAALPPRSHAAADA